MKLKNTVLSLLDIFRLNKGQKIVEKPAQPLVPLLQRLQPLPAMSDELYPEDKAQFVADVIEQNIAKKKLPTRVSKRVVHKISRYYGLRNLRGYGLFRAISETDLLMLKSARA